MAAISSCFNYFSLVILLCLAALTGRADDTLTLSSTANMVQKQLLRPYLSGWEDLTGKTAPDEALQHPERLVPLKTLKGHSATSVYWLQTPLQTKEAFDAPVVLSFTHLTYVDAYLYHQGQLVWHRQAGAFLPRSRVALGDSRFHIKLPLAPNKTYTLLLRVHHTKGYQPYFDFSLQQQDAFIQEMRQHEQADAWSQGAVMIFLLYTLLSWWVSRYRPYLWLGLFIAGIGLYGLCSARYFIDWFFPERPITGWLFNGPFLHLGLLGFYLLVVDFWQLPKYNPAIYRFGKVCMAVLVAVSVSGTCINYFTGNFNLANTINLWAFLFPFSFITVLMVRCYHRLDRAQKYLYYGIILFVVAGLFVTLSSALIKEQALLFAPYVSNFTSVVVFLLFSTGLKEALRQHEIDKGAVLEQLTQLQQQQNTLLEKKVEERTGELLKSNQLLQDQAGLLANRNTTIETLINELSHRVKNNLQLLYSLSSLQLPNLADEAARHILKGNMARIKAMMVVNQKLDYLVDSPRVALASLVSELTEHLQNIYDRPKKVKILASIPEDLELPSRQVLSLGLILTELLTNSFKYAFPHSTDPCISITVSLSQNQILLVYADNGCGMSTTPTNNPSSMGLSLVKDLTRQLAGTLTTQHQPGLAYSFTIPV